MNNPLPTNTTTFKPKQLLHDLPLNSQIPVLQKWTPSLPSNDMSSEHLFFSNNPVKQLSNRFRSSTLSLNKAKRSSSDNIETLSQTMFSYKNRSVEIAMEDEDEDVKELRRLGKGELEDWLKKCYATKEVGRFVEILERSKVPVKLYWLQELRFLEGLNLKFNFKEIFTFDFLK